MPLLKSDYYTSKDYWNQPEGERAELIDGKFYDMAPPVGFIRRFPVKFIRLLQIISIHITDFAKFTLHHLPLILTQMIKTGWNPMFP